MGKWTLEHHDEVLRDKVKSMVQGAIKRIHAEKEGPPITYEAFVASLDEGDSFTTSLIDILVKEVAERRQRNESDRRLISERTAKSLRMQAAPLHVYRAGSGFTRDRVRRNATIPPSRHRTSAILSDSDGDDEYGTILGGMGAFEGAQFNSSLYDAYSASTFDLPSVFSRPPERVSLPPHPSESTAGGSWLVPDAPPRSPPAHHAFPTFPSGPIFSSLGGPGSTSLGRQPSIRRLHRPRIADVNDFAQFTTRRRSTFRSTSHQDDASREGSSSDAAGRTAADSASTTRDDGPLPRPFEIGAWLTRRAALRDAASGRDGTSGGSSIVPNTSSSQMWYSMTASASPGASPEPTLPAALSRRSSATDAEGEGWPVVAPRLRRGGLRPPESLLLYGPGSPALEGSIGRDRTLDVSSSPAEVPTEPASPARPEIEREASPTLAAGATAPTSSAQTLVHTHLAPRSPSPFIT